MKKLFTFFALLFFSLTALAEEFVVDGIKYNVDTETMQAEVVLNNPRYSGDVVIPASIMVDGGEYTVTGIGVYAFYRCDITSVEIPNTVEDIADRAFYRCGNLAMVNIPNSVTTIGSSAFEDCSALTLVDIPNSVTSIGGSAFRGCSCLVSVDIPNSVISIGVGAFNRCFSLSSVTVPNSVKSLGYAAFEYCTGLTSVTIGSSVGKIDISTFANCEKLENVYCLSEIVPETDRDAFDNTRIENCTLYVQKKSVNGYNAVAPWNKFGKILSLEGNEPVVPTEPLQCATPTITFVNGKLHFECETEGAKYHYTVEYAKSGESDGSISLDDTKTYTVTCYATAEGYNQSETAEITITIDRADVNGDGDVNVFDITSVAEKILGQ